MTPNERLHATRFVYKLPSAGLAQIVVSDFSRFSTIGANAHHEALQISHPRSYPRYEAWQREAL